MRQLCLQVDYMVLSEPEFSEEVHDFVSAGKDCIRAFEGSLSKESLEHCGARVSPGLPLTVGHRDLVQVCEERVHPVEVDAARV